MFSSRLLKGTLLVSFCVHGLIILQLPLFNPFLAERRERKIEITYLRKVPEKKLTFKSGYPQPAAKYDPFLNLDAKIGLNKNISPPAIDREDVFKGTKSILPKTDDLSKPAFFSSDTISIKRVVVLPPLNIDKIKNPSYLSYYQVVHEKIRRAGCRIYAGNEAGEVNISFIISREGNLTDVKLDTDKSVNNRRLRNIALKSLKDASPFPHFPRELDYLQIPFNITISFEAE